MYMIRAIGSGTKYLCLCASSGLVAPSCLGDSRLRISVRASCARACAMCDSWHGSDLSCSSTISCLVVLGSCYGSCTEGAGDHTCARRASVGAQSPVLRPERTHARMIACTCPQGSFPMIRVRDTLSRRPCRASRPRPSHWESVRISRYAKAQNQQILAIWH